VKRAEGFTASSASPHTVQPVTRRPRRGFSFCSCRDVRIASIAARDDVGRVETHEEDRPAVAAGRAVSCKHKMWVDSSGPPR
jgi:hypothetical protein